MDIVSKFKTYLFSQSSAPSAITIKNYAADVRRFISWYQKTYHTSFIPSALTVDVITAYQSLILTENTSETPSTRSAKRYLSSLRKFAAFLEASGAIVTNPFHLITNTHNATGSFFFKEFKQFLYSEQASKLTIKNYLADIKQFLAWLERVTGIDTTNDFNALFTKIDNYVLEQYKSRLYHDMQLSPVSINRKLSSLRRYIRWLGAKGVINIALLKETEESLDTKPSEKQLQQHIQTEIPLTALQGLVEENDEKKESNYSRFAPIRLLQKTTKAINIGTDLLIFSPLVYCTEMIHYTFWKKGKRKIFAPVTTILKSASYDQKAIAIKTIIPKETSIQPPRSANPASVLQKKRAYHINTNPDVIHNFTKALYAPLEISTKHMHWREKLWHQLQYARPQWYRKYHSYAFAHYLHLSVLLLATVIIGIALFQSWSGNNYGQRQAVLSARATAPPRILTFQGRLLDKTNTPITTETPLRFALYNSPTATGEALLWQETQNVKPDQNGYFTVTLGKHAKLNQNLFVDNPGLYIGISVANGPELAPRQQIPTANYAADSQSIQGLKPITDSPNLTQNVLLALDSAGNLTIGGTASHTFQATGGQFSVSGQTLLLTTNPGSNGNIKIAPDGSGIIDLQGPIQNTSNYSSPGGIPGAVEVKDILSVLATTSSQSALVINQNGTGDIISGQSNGIDKFRLDQAGNAYLGGNIILNGDTIGTTSNIFDIAGATVNDLSIGNNASFISMGGMSGVTSINNSIAVHGTSTLVGAVMTQGLLTTNGGITVPAGQKVTLSDFASGSIPFINGEMQVASDQSNFSWNDNNHIFTVAGSLCIVTDANGTCPGSVSGTIYAENESIGNNADLAEEYISSQQLQPGDIVAMEGSGNTSAILKSTTPYQKNIIGIVSTNPGITLDTNVTTDSAHPYKYPLALQGRVPVEVSTINGPIMPGDNLTSSSIPGVAMKATESGQTIGKALESYANPDPTAVGQIMAFVNLSYQSSPTAITDTGDLAIATESATVKNASNTTQTPFFNLSQSINNIANTIALGAVQAQTITTQSLHVTTDNIMIGSQTLKDYIATLVDQLINQELNKRLAQIQQPQIINPQASDSAQITDQTASSSATPTPSATDSATMQLAANQTASSSSAIYNSITATPEASLASGNDASAAATTGESQSVNSLFDPISSNTTHFASVASFSGQLTSIPNLESDFGTFTQGLIALGPTSLTDVAISSGISLDNNLKITANSLDTVGSDLNIQPLRQGNINFMGGLITIDTQGNLTVNGNATFAHNVTIDGELAAGVIAPIPNQDIIINLKGQSAKSASKLIVTSASGSAVLQINQSGDIASSGEAQFKTVTAGGFSIIRGAQADTSMTETIANSSAGKGTITAYETERTIITPYVTDHSLIYITPTSDTGNVTPYLARQTAADPTKGIQGSFTVAVPVMMTKDIDFNWWIVN